MGPCSIEPNHQAPLRICQRLAIIFNHLAHPLPAAYDDSWQALRWVASHANATGSGGEEEPWLADHGDFSRLCVGGESAGANIAHHMAMRVGTEELGHGVRISSAIMVHPYFLGAGRVSSEETDPGMAQSVVTMWRVVCPGSTGVEDDPWINPLAPGAPGLKGLACGRVLVCLAEKDVVRDRGHAYAEGLRASGWGGEVEVLEVAGQGHCFHLVDFASADAVAQDDAIARFVNM
nr:unnamed protein product [Digitaria exilis]